MDIRQVESQAATTRSRPAHRQLRKIMKWGSLSIFVVVVGLLVAVVLPTLLGDRTIVIISGSMEPTIHMGAAAVLKPVASSDLQVGDVVAYTPNSKGAISIVHRIVNISERDGVRFYRTRGDANPSADVNEFTLPATAWRMWYNLPMAGYVVAFASSRWGILLLIVVPAALLSWMKAADWRKSRALQPQPAPPPVRES
jgi:signal peptidase I